MPLKALLMFFALCVLPSVAQARSECRLVHGPGYCRVHSNRVAIKVLRKQIYAQVRRTHATIPKLKPVSQLTWSTPKLERANHWHRHMLRVLHREPTYYRSPQDYARVVIGQWGWDMIQYHCVDILWGQRESGWDPNNVNSIGASGIPQRLGNGTLPWNWYSDFRVQIRWGFDYIRHRYGSPCAALSHSYAHNWY